MPPAVDVAAGGRRVAGPLRAHTCWGTPAVRRHSTRYSAGSRLLRALARVVRCGRIVTGAAGPVLGAQGAQRCATQRQRLCVRAVHAAREHGAGARVAYWVRGARPGSLRLGRAPIAGLSSGEVRAPGCNSTWRCLTVGLITCSALRARGPRRRQRTDGVDRQWVVGEQKPQSSTGRDSANSSDVTRTSGGGPVSVSMWPGLSRHLAPHTLDFWRRRRV